LINSYWQEVTIKGRHTEFSTDPIKNIEI